jgi:hypothetical protein
MQTSWRAGSNPASAIAFRVDQLGDPLSRGFESHPEKATVTVGETGPVPEGQRLYPRRQTDVTAGETAPDRAGSRSPSRWKGNLAIARNRWQPGKTGIAL